MSIIRARVQLFMQNDGQVIYEIVLDPSQMNKMDFHLPIMVRPGTKLYSLALVPETDEFEGVCRDLETRL